MSTSKPIPLNVLVLAPHPDDETIGCGGTLCLHTARNDRISVVYLTSGELGLEHLSIGEARACRECEARRAGKILGLSALHFLRQPDWGLDSALEEATAALEPILQSTRPDLIYLPHPLEWHPDHRAALSLLRRSLPKNDLLSPRLRGYEVWTPLTDYDHVENISKVMPRKLRALASFRSQLVDFNYVQAVRGLNQYRGALAAKCAYAEVFQELTLS